MNFSVNGASASLQNYSGSSQTTTGVASVNYTVAPAMGGIDPVYDIIADGGRYNFNYQGQAEVKGTDLRTRLASSTLDGDFPALADPSAYSNHGPRLQASSRFTDTAGVDNNSSVDSYTHSSDASWIGQKTVFKKLLFQYGTVFNLDLYQYVGSGNNGSAEFFSTGKITQIEIPFEATLQSGAQDAGLGSLSSLYGRVVNSATAGAENTNWDFGNNGGGFTPPVPEPQTWAMLLAGLLAVGQVARRRQAR